MEDSNYCKRCGKSINTKNMHSITFGAWTACPEIYYVCESCYNRLLRYVLTRPVNKEDKHD